MTAKKMGQKKLNKKETAAQQKIQEAEVKRQRLLAKDTLYGYLLKTGLSIQKAKQLCYETQKVIEAAFQKQVFDYQRKLSEDPVSMLQIVDIMGKGKDFKPNQDLINLFKNEKISTFNSLITGMQAAMDSFVAEEISERKLETLKATFL